MPARSRALKLMVPLPCRVTPSHTMEVPLTLAVMSVQVAPLSSEPNNTSPGSRLTDSVPVMVWLAVRVLKSPASVPVSALRARPLRLGAGAWLS